MINFCLLTEHPSGPSASKLFSLQQDASAWRCELPAMRSWIRFFQNIPLPSFAHLWKNFLLFWGHWDSSCSSDSGHPPTQNGNHISFNDAKASCTSRMSILSMITLERSLKGENTRKQIAFRGELESKPTGPTSP